MPGFRSVKVDVNVKGKSGDEPRDGPAAIGTQRHAEQRERRDAYRRGGIGRGSEHAGAALLRAAAAHRVEPQRRRAAPLPPDTVERVRWIQLLYAAGLSSRTIVEFLPCVHTGIAGPEMIARLRAERDRLDEHMRDLATTRARLDSVLASAEFGATRPAGEAAGVSGSTSTRRPWPGAQAEAGFIDVSHSGC